MQIVSATLVSSAGAPIISGSGVLLSYFWDGGSAVSTTVQSGGLEIVGGVQNGTSVHEGVAYSTVVLSGGEVIVSSGGVVVGATVSSGGTLTLLSGGWDSNRHHAGQWRHRDRVERRACAQRQCWQRRRVQWQRRRNHCQQRRYRERRTYPRTFEPGFGAAVKQDQIDLQGIAFGATKKSSARLSFTEAAGNLSGTLTVTDGAHTANILLLGNHMASEFVAASDGNGGTPITLTSSSTNGGHGHGNAIASPVTS